MKLKITRLAGPGFPDDPGARLIETGKVVIGRGDDCTWRLPDEARTLSKRHCEVMFQGNVYVLRDTSTNGVFVNDAATPVGNGRSVVLRHGDRFRAADFVFGVEVVVPGADAAPPRMPPGAGAVSPAVSPAITPQSFDGFDAFATDDTPFPDAGLFPDAEPGGWGGDWSDDAAESAGFGAQGLGPALFPEAPGLPDFADFAPAAGGGNLGAPAPDDPWLSPAGLPEGDGAGDGRAAELAGRLVDCLQVLHRLHEQMAGRLGIVQAGGGAAPLPVGTGAGIVADLLGRPDGSGLAELDRFVAEVETLARLVAQTVEAQGGEAWSGAPPAAPFDEDPFA